MRRRSSVIKLMLHEPLDRPPQDDIEGKRAQRVMSASQRFVLVANSRTSERIKQSVGQRRGKHLVLPARNPQDCGAVRGKLGYIMDGAE